MPTDEHPTPTDVERGTWRGRLAPWAVILHNDDFNSMAYVVTCLINTVAGMSLERATETMTQAHTQGRALVVTCPRELAEFYRDRLEELILTATIEPA